MSFFRLNSETIIRFLLIFALNIKRITIQISRKKPHVKIFFHLLNQFHYSRTQGWFCQMSFGNSCTSWMSMMEFRVLDIRVSTFPLWFKGPSRNTESPSYLHKVNRRLKSSLWSWKRVWRYIEAATKMKVEIEVLISSGWYSLGERVIIHDIVIYGILVLLFLKRLFTGLNEASH